MDYLQKKSIRSVAAAITGFLRHSVRKIGITREKLPSCIALAVCPLVTFYLFEIPIILLRQCISKPSC